MAARWRGDSGGQGPELGGAGHTPGEDAAGATQRPSHEWPWLFGSKYGGRGREAPLGPWLQHCGRPPSRCRRLPVCCVLLAAARLPEHLRERARTLTTAFTGLTAVGPHGSSVPELTGQGSSPRVAASVLTHGHTTMGRVSPASALPEVLRKVPFASGSASRIVARSSEG